ncbi:MAG: helix-turn-helix domain-containing protein [Pseudomonadales bacterium]|nr:helix-turn-helix domain-containing protein [Pseudomonadales bacterium]
MLLNPDDYEDARQCRDPRFDGRFFVGVLTTGIYCRPVCPVRIPKKENVQLYKTAAGASAAGFRPCLRCRPESSPGTPAWSGSSWKVSRALQLIDQGFLDEGSVDELSDQIAVGPRQLSRLFQNHLGASPVEVAQTRRLHFAKKLIDETNMPLSEICFAAGFGSIRRFNAVFNKTYERSPKQLRDKRNVTEKDENGLSEGIRITLSYRPPFDWKSHLAFLAYRSIPGVEVVTATSYARTISLDGAAGHFLVEFEEESHRVQVEIHYPESRQLYQIIDRIKSIFDLRADSEQIDKFLSKDKTLKSMVKKFPGLRVPGCWSEFEVAVRAVLGQQVTVKAASTLVSRIAERYGKSYICNIEGLTHVFPGPEKLQRTKMDNMGIVTQRIVAIRTIAAQVAKGEMVIDCSVDTAEFVEQICTIKGIGEWTAFYIAMRALNDPNAFPYSDLILRRAIDKDEELTPKQLLLRSEPWQPWRAYAVILLWKNYGTFIKKSANNKKKRKN